MQSPTWTSGDLELITVDEHVFKVDRAELAKVAPSLTTQPSLALTEPHARTLIVDKFLTALLHNTLDASDLSPRSLLDVFACYGWCTKTHDRATDPASKFAKLCAQAAREGDCPWSIPFAMFALVGDSVAVVHLLNEKGGWPPRLPAWLEKEIPHGWAHSYQRAKEEQVRARNWDRKVKLGDWFDQYHEELSNKEHPKTPA